jgi:rod shape-determining protein MreC
VAASRRTGRSRLTIALLVLTSVAVLTLDFRDSSLISGARRGASTVFSPLRGVAETATEPFSNAWHGITDYGDLEDENRRLRDELEDRKGESVRDEDAAEQLGALLDQLDIDWVGDIPTVTAAVIAGPGSNFSHTIEIGKGSGDGFKVGMPVITGAGLVGKLVQVTEHRSTVMLITDPEFAVGVRLVTDGTQGTARGRGEGRNLVVDTGLGAEVKVRKGTSLTTSGVDTSPFPAAVPVGKVVETRPGSGGLTLDLMVEPLADTQRLAYVTVMLREPPP